MMVKLKEVSQVVQTVMQHQNFFTVNVFIYYCAVTQTYRYLERKRESANHYALQNNILTSQDFVDFLNFCLSQVIICDRKIYVPKSVAKMIPFLGQCGYIYVLFHIFFCQQTAIGQN